MATIPDDVLAWHDAGHGHFLWCTGPTDNYVIAVSWEYICDLYSGPDTPPYEFIPGADPQYVAGECTKELNARGRWIEIFATQPEPLRDHTDWVYDGDPRTD